MIQESNLTSAGECFLGIDSHDSEVIVRQRAGHAFDVMKSTTNEELNSYDGAIAVVSDWIPAFHDVIPSSKRFVGSITAPIDPVPVILYLILGGDGFFNETLNGFLSSRHKAPFPPAPSDFLNALGNDGNSFVHDPNAAGTETHYNKESDPLLTSSAYNESGLSLFGTNDGSHSIDHKIEYPFPNQRFRFGIIPAGSTDAIFICTTGGRDPITSALHIVLGKRVRLNVAQVVRWKTTSTSKVEPCVRYAASFAG
ncbi:hypothetical protein REPUB_Repub08aG0010400 [Reevesia pubescens]